MPILQNSFSLEYWLSYIESLHPQEIELGLERVKALAQEADLFPNCPVVLVGGTNGKGSTVSTLATLLAANGLRVGAYISPHLLKFNERIVINGQCIDDYQLCRIFAKIEESRIKLGISLTFFEFTTLAALAYFKESACDIMVLEVGLGGRLDAVNSVEPSLSIITTIDLDHMDRLGDTLDKIAIEKAGILRKDTLALIGEAACSPVFLSEAARIGSLVIPVQTMSLPKCNVPEVSASLALSAVKFLAQMFPQFKNGKLNNLSEILRQAPLPGRFQKYFSKVETIFDIAHNPSGAHWLDTQLNREKIKYDQNNQKSQRNIAVWSSFKDKDLKGIVQAIKHSISLWIIAPLDNSLDNSRGASLEALQEALQSQGVSADLIISEPTVVAAYKKAYSVAEKQDKIIVFGSCVTVSKVMLSLEQNFVYMQSFYRGQQGQQIQENL